MYIREIKNYDEKENNETKGCGYRWRDRAFHHAERLKTIYKPYNCHCNSRDDGGGSGKLREDLGMLPPGDIRNCILALADTEPINGRFIAI